MNAKQMIAILSVLAVAVTAFAVIPADAADGYQVTAEYGYQKTTPVVVVILPEAVPADEMAATIEVTGDGVDLDGKITFRSGFTRGLFKLSEPLADGTYSVVVTTKSYGVSAPATLVVGDEPVVYTISKALGIQNGDISVKASAEAGEIVQVAVMPNAGYELDYLTLDGEAIVGTSFKMPASNVVVGAVFKEKSEGTLVIENVEYKEISSGNYFVITMNEAPVNGVLYLYIDGVLEVQQDINKQKVAIKIDGSFDASKQTYKVRVTSVMGDDEYPKTPVTTYSISKALGIQNGDISVKAYAQAGETVQVAVMPNTGYELDYLTLDGEAIVGTSFKMPASNVTVGAVFKAKQCTVTFVIAEGFSNKVTATVGEPIQAPAGPAIKGAEFKAWCTEDGKEFDFTAPIKGDITLYAVYGPEAPSTEQTSKLVASLVYEEKDGVTIVATAYDENIIGKGTATVTVLQEVDFLGLKAYLEVGKFTIDFDTSESYAYQNITEEASEYITESGNYAMVADIVLDNKTTASSNYIVFDAVINEQA